MRSLRCLFGRHDWVPWTLCDEKNPGPVVRLWCCARCSRIESLR